MALHMLNRCLGVYPSFNFHHSALKNVSPMKISCYTVVSLHFMFKGPILLTSSVFVQRSKDCNRLGSTTVVTTDCALLFCGWVQWIAVHLQQKIAKQQNHNQINYYE